MKQRLSYILLVALAGWGMKLHAEPIAETAAAPIIEVVDAPTTEVVNHYGYNISFRFGKDGGVQNKTVFGVFPRLNLGFGLDAEEIIGTGDSRLNKPTINLKFRPFDGRKLLPSLAIGYDGQGYIFNKHTDEYEQREKGFYVVAGWPLFVPEFNFTLGANVYDFDESNNVRGFTSLTYVYEELIGLLFEYDSFSEYKERRFNFGARLYVTRAFTVDLLGRDVPKTYRSEDRETERVVKLNYTGSF